MFDGEFTRVTNSMSPELAKTHVILWDIGPQKPVAPAKPALPKGKEGDAEHDVAMVEFREALDDYQIAYKAFIQAKIEYAKWQKDQGGAIERFFFSCDAHDAIQRDPKRYHISASTRGHEKLKNHGLPEGHKPGRGHAENVRRAEEGEAEYAALKKADPVFGTPELRP